MPAVSVVLPGSDVEAPWSLALKATVPLAKLFFAPGDAPLKEFASERLLSVRANFKQNRVAEFFDKYNLLALPVVDEKEELLGVITVDDVVALLRQG